jgi:hypothetical protein
VERAARETTSPLERLTDQVQDLDFRVRALELQAAAATAPPTAPESLRSGKPEFAFDADLSAKARQSAGMVPVLGKAVLGVAGAYLLRAAAESGRLPWTAAVTVGVLYAAMWLVGASLVSRAAASVRGVYAATSALIFFPMLWETTAQFKALTPAIAAAGLIGFSTLGFALGRLRESAPGLWATSIPAAATAVVLMVATGVLLPFAIALLVIAALVEIAGEGGRTARPWVAFLADAGVALVLYVAASPRSIEAYSQVGRFAAASLCLALLATYAVSIGTRTAGMRRKITFFEGAQLASVFTLTVGGLLFLTHAAGVLGAILLAASALLYGTALRRFGDDASARNHHVFAGFGLALAVTGGMLWLPPPTAGMLFAALALAAAWGSARAISASAAVHAALLLALAAWLSGLVEHGRAAMVGGDPPGWPTAPLWVFAVVSLAIWAMCPSAAALTWLRATAAVVTVFIASVFLVAIAAAAGEMRDSEWLPALRTLAICGVALTAGILGSHWRVPWKERTKPAELVWIGYTAMALVTFKLLTQDFRESHPAALAIALLGYGGVLIFGPRLTRSSPR